MRLRVAAPDSIVPRQSTWDSKSGSMTFPPYSFTVLSLE